jgi:hypothetical protein
MHLHSALPAWPSCPRISSRLPRAACLARLYALVHCTGAHPCLSRSTLVPLRLSVARPVVPPHMLAPSRACAMYHTPDSRAPSAPGVPMSPYVHSCTLPTPLSRPALVRRALHLSCAHTRAPAQRAARLTLVFVCLWSPTSRRRFGSALHTRALHRRSSTLEPLSSRTLSVSPRPCARSPSRDVHRSSNLPAHLSLYLADRQALPSSPTPSSRTHDQLGPSRVMPHLPSSLAHMLTRVRACQLCAPSRVASSSSTCERRMPDALSPLANTSCSHASALCRHSRRMHCVAPLGRRIYSPVPMRLAISNLRPHMTVPELISVPSPSQRVCPATHLAVSLGLLGSVPACLSASLANANPARPVPATPDHSAPQRQPTINC